MTTISIDKCRLSGVSSAPTSKSVTHRRLIASALSKKKCVISDILYSDDINVTLNALEKLNCKIIRNKSSVIVDGSDFLKEVKGVIDCKQSGSSLRFLIPIALLTDKEVTFTGSNRLLERGLEDYQDLCNEYNFLFERKDDTIKVKGKLTVGEYYLKGNSSSQYSTGMILALASLRGKSQIHISESLQSRSYIRLTCSIVNEYGIDCKMNDNDIIINSNGYKAIDSVIEADLSNAAYLDCFNYIGSSVNITNLSEDSIQPDKVYKELFEKIKEETPTIDIAECVDLAPILISLSAVNNGATLLNTKRLAIKESDRAKAMQEELKKFDVEIIVEENMIIIPKSKVAIPKEVLESHDDHRIAMALIPLLTLTGGKISNIEAINKSFPNYLEKLEKLGLVYSID